MSNKKPVVLVTGASRGLGRGIAIHLAEEGYSVSINYAGNLKAAEETVSLCESVKKDTEQQFFAVQADIGSVKDRERLFNETIDKFGRIDALVNNAGIAPKVRQDMTRTTVESFQELMNVNLAGPYFLTQKVVNYWLNEKPEKRLSSGFKIIFISSISSTAVSINRPEYCISKAGLSMVNQLWGVRLAEEGIQVMELRPGIMETDMTSGVKEKYDKLLAEGIVPQKRWGQPEDVALGVSSILAGSFPFTTGESIYIDGGLNISRL